MRTMYDNTGLPASPPHVDITAFYIGGADPFRVWPKAEIDGIKTRWRLPIWVTSHPIDGAEGHNEGFAAAKMCEKLGQPKGTCIALDLEMAVNTTFCKMFDDAVVAGGYRTMFYGSASTVFKNGNPSGGYWAAQWDGKAEMLKGAVAKQYANDTMIGHPWDLSIVEDSVPLWDTNPPVIKIRDEMLIDAGMNHVVPIAFKKGAYSRIVLLADNGRIGSPPAKIRIAENSDHGKWTIVHVLVDSAQGATEVAFADPANTHGVSIQREDNTPCLVSVALY